MKIEGVPAELQPEKGFSIIGEEAIENQEEILEEAGISGDQQDRGIEEFVADQEQKEAA